MLFLRDASESVNKGTREDEKRVKIMSARNQVSRTLCSTFVLRDKVKLQTMRGEEE
jgi:hypothetical protein